MDLTLDSASLTCLFTGMTMVSGQAFYNCLYLCFVGALYHSEPNEWTDIVE